MMSLEQFLDSRRDHMELVDDLSEAMQGDSVSPPAQVAPEPEFQERSFQSQETILAAAPADLQVIVCCFVCF
jgi:hypothetical protein